MIRVKCGTEIKWERCGEMERLRVFLYEAISPRVFQITPSLH